MARGPPGGGGGGVAAFSRGGGRPGVTVAAFVEAVALGAAAEPADVTGGKDVAGGKTEDARQHVEAGHARWGCVQVESSWSHSLRKRPVWFGFNPCAYK